MTEHKFFKKEYPCVPCLIEKELYPLIEDNYNDKLTILKKLEKIIIRDDLGFETYRNYYHDKWSLEHIKIINEKLLRLEKMVFDNIDLSDVLSEVVILQYTSRYFANQDMNYLEKSNYLKSQKNYPQTRLYK